MRIDNTQYSEYTRCPYGWKEKYFNKVHRPWIGERDDALALGIAVHDGLYNGYHNGTFAVRDSVLNELTMSPDALFEVNTMIEAYRTEYPSGPIELPWRGLEDPLNGVISGTLHTITAKVDGWCRAETGITIKAGNGDLYIPPGIYSFETKTKRSGFDRGLYIAEWEAAMQASFQLIVLKLNAEKLNIDPAEVRGIIVNVIERPNVYEPRRTCQGCGKMFQVKLYTQIGKEFGCPGCGHVQSFKGSIGQARVDPPYLWRFMVERSDDRLMGDLATILQVADLMEGERPDVPSIMHRTNCVNVQWKSKCMYYEPHNALVPVNAIEYPGFELFNPTAYLEREPNV